MKYLIVGSYTHKQSKGIHTFTFDDELGNFTELASYGEVMNPSYICIDPITHSLYSTIETTKAQGSGVGYYKIQDGFRLEFLGMEKGHGDDPCHLHINSQELIVSNYSSGNFSVHTISSNGSVSAAKQIIQHNGQGPNGNRQESAHVHFTTSVPDLATSIADNVNTRKIAVVDLGMDQVIFYNKIGVNYIEWSRIYCEPGAGPRHLAFHPAAPWIYIVNELNSTISMYKADSEYSKFEYIQTVATLPVDFTANNQCAAIVMSPDHRFVYITNRGHDSVVCFSLGDNGELKKEFLMDTRGHWPRDCGITPNGKYMLIANEHSDTVSIFSRNLGNGALEYQSVISISEPSCIRFYN